MPGIVPNPALFPSRDEQQRLNNRLTTQLAAAEARVAAGPVTPTHDPAAFQSALAAYDFAQAHPLDDVLDWTIAQLETGVVHMNHPRYLGLFNPAPTFPSQCADRIAAVFNPQLATTTTSPAPVAIEAHLVKAMANRAGLPPGSSGHFTTGGSEANLTALICALTRAADGFAATGARAFAGQPVFYISQDSHLAWIKIAHQSGIGRNAVRQIPTDAQGRMDMPALAACLAKDQAAGCIPVMIVATAGTTNAGMIDPLAPCAALARAAGLWFHVDAAWGGGLLASETLRPLLAGIEHADSVTIDAHKWFATSMGCGLFLTPHASVLVAAFAVVTSFMPSHIPASDPYVTTVQWSRRFLGLRLFLALASGGWHAHAVHVERAVALAHALAGRLSAAGWSILNDPALAVLCAVPPAGSAEIPAIVNAVLASGAAWVSVARFAGQTVLRACITHGETSPADIAQVAAALHGFARRAAA